MTGFQDDLQATFALVVEHCLHVPRRVVLQGFFLFAGQELAATGTKHALKKEGEAKNGGCEDGIHDLATTLQGLPDIVAEYAFGLFSFSLCSWCGRRRGRRRGFLREECQTNKQNEKGKETTHGSATASVALRVFAFAVQGESG